MSIFDIKNNILLFIVLPETWYSPFDWRSDCWSDVLFWKKIEGLATALREHAKLEVPKQTFLSTYQAVEEHLYIDEVPTAAPSVTDSESE